MFMFTAFGGTLANFFLKVILDLLHCVKESMQVACSGSCIGLVVVVLLVLVAIVVGPSAGSVVSGTMLDGSETLRRTVSNGVGLVVASTATVAVIVTSHFSLKFVFVGPTGYTCPFRTLGVSVCNLDGSLQLGYKLVLSVSEDFLDESFTSFLLLAKLGAAAVS